MVQSPRVIGKGAGTEGYHTTRDIQFSPDNRTMYVSVNFGLTMPGTWHDEVPTGSGNGSRSVAQMQRGATRRIVRMSSPSTLTAAIGASLPPDRVTASALRPSRDGQSMVPHERARREG